ncbi:type II toxin-antitoxin system VapC family toxin [Lacunimicrobium album]
MNILVDTNVLLRIVETSASDHEVAIHSTKILDKTHTLVIVPQVGYEFWSVATRTKAANGLELSSSEADQKLEEMLVFFTLIDDERGIFHRWWDCVRTLEIKGVQSYDARLVAAMKRHQITHILTFNDAHFRRFSDVTVIRPGDVQEGNSI